MRRMRYEMPLGFRIVYNWFHDRRAGEREAAMSWRRGMSRLNLPLRWSVGFDLHRRDVGKYPYGKNEIDLK